MTEINKETPKTKRKKKNEINKLAEMVLANDTELDVPKDEVADEISTSIAPTVSSAPIINFQEAKALIEEEKKPKILTKGTSKTNLIVIKRAEREITAFLESVFGNKDGAYFEIAGSVFREGPIKYKVVLVEDKNNFKYKIWFDISKISFA